MAAQIACLCLIFAPYGDQLSRSVGLPFLLLMAGFGLLSPGRQSVAYSHVLLACIVYLVAMTLASLAAADAPLADVWRQFRISVLIVAFLAITGSLVAAFPGFPRVLFLVLGTVGALSAAINIFLFSKYMVPTGSSLFDFRLIASIGMPAYANSTNISATYAVSIRGDCRSYCQIPATDLLAGGSGSGRRNIGGRYSFDAGSKCLVGVTCRLGHPCADRLSQNSRCRNCSAVGGCVHIASGPSRTRSPYGAGLKLPFRSVVEVHRPYRSTASGRLRILQPGRHHRCRLLFPGPGPQSGVVGLVSRRCRERHCDDVYFVRRHLLGTSILGSDG